MLDVPGGHARATCAPPSSSASSALRRVAQRSAACSPRGHQRDQEDLTRTALARRAPAARVPRRSGRRPLLDLRGRRRAGRATRASSASGAWSELTELWVGAVASPGRGIGRRLLERCWPGPPTPDLGRARASRTGAPADLSLYTDVRRDAGQRATGTCAQRPSDTSSAARRRSTRTEPAVHALDARARRRASGSGSSRSRSATSARCCTSSSAATAPASRPWTPATATRRALCWVSSGRRDRPGGGRAARGPRPGRARRARPRGEDAGARELRVFCTTDSLVAAATGCARLGFRVSLAELGDVLGAAAGPRPLPADAPGAAALMRRRPRLRMRECA